MMRVSCLFASMLLSALSAQAAAQGGAVAPRTPAANATAGSIQVAPLSGEPGVSAVIPAPVPVPMDSVPPLASDSEAAQQQQQQALKKIALLRVTVKSTTPERNFLSGLFSSSVRPVDTELLAEMNRVIEQYPDLPDTAEVYQLKAQVHQRIENYHAAALDWLVSVAAYPDSSFAVEARNGLKELSSDQLKSQAKTLQAMTVKLNTLSGGREQRVADLLAFLGTLRERDFAAPIAAECSAFLMRNRNYPEQDRILDALAHQQALLDNESAIYYFNELLTLYPDSALRADGMLSIGNIQRNGLKHYEEAATSYKSVIAKYPDSSETKLAYEALADMYDVNMRDYSNAIKTYDAIVTRYKDDPLVLRSLQALAHIYQDKTSQPLEAIAAYRKLADIFKGKDGLAALLQAEKLAQYTVSDWKLSIDINQSIINGYPDSDQAPRALYANAGIYEEKLKDREQALSLYQLFVSHYPGHDLAGQAKQHINALQQQKK